MEELQNFNVDGRIKLDIRYLNLSTYTTGTRFEIIDPLEKISEKSGKNSEKSGNFLEKSGKFLEKFRKIPENFRNSVVITA